jgi:O-antigen/teichoic acid export membrane protein
MSRNILYNLLSLASTIVLGFVISPMILRSLGDARYGVWALFGELLVYLGLMDFGVRGSVSYFVGKSITLNNRADIKRYTSSAFVGLLALASAAYLGVLVLIYLFQRQLMRNYSDRTDVVLAAVIFAGLFCLGFPLEVYSSAVTGSHQRYLVSKSEIVSRVVSSSLMLAVLLTRPSLVGLALAQAGGRIVYWIQNRRYARKHAPDAQVDFGSANWTTIREILNYGTGASAAEIARLFGDRKDVVVTTAFLGPSRVPTFSFARQFTSLMMNVCASITQAIRPNLVHHWTLGEKAAFFDIYYTIARYAAFLITMMAAFLAVFGRDFIGLWIGERFVTGDPRFRTDIILLVLLAGYVPRAMNSISVQALLATRNQSSYARAIVVDSIVNLALSLALVRPYGTLGLAIGSVIPMLVTNLLVVPLLVFRKVGVSIRRYWVEGVGPSILVAVAAALLGVAYRQWSGAASWWTVGMGGSLMAVTGLALGYVFLLKNEHRKRLSSIVRNRLPGKIAA